MIVISSQLEFQLKYLEEEFQTTNSGWFSVEISQEFLNSVFHISLL